jgi:hypothetical protein
MTSIPDGEQFPFVEGDPSRGAASRLPYLPITLTLGGCAVSVLGLLDTGATVSVLPHEVGVQLGLVRGQQKARLQLEGDLASLEARGAVLLGTVGRFALVRLVFAWTKATNVPVILGQVNFFEEFDVAFFRKRGVFEIKPASPGSCEHAVSSSQPRPPPPAPGCGLPAGPAARRGPPR